MTVTFGTPKAKPGGFPKPALKGALIVYLLSDYDEKAPSKWDPTSPKASVAYCIVVDSNAADQQVAPAGTAFEKVTWRGVLAAGRPRRGRRARNRASGVWRPWRESVVGSGVRRHPRGRVRGGRRGSGTVPISRVSTAAGGEKAPPF